MLGIAAREADIVGVNPSLAAGYVGPEVLETTSAEYYHQRIEWIRQAAGARFDQLELQCLTFLVQIVPDRDEAIARLAGAMSVTPEQVDGSPIALIGTTDQITETPPPASGASSASPTSWCTRRRWRRSHRWWPRSPGPRGGRRPARIGIFGGTFDPIHTAHLEVAEAVRVALGLDRMLLVVANQPWQKEGERPVTPAEDRLRHGRGGRGRDGPGWSPAASRSTGAGRPTPSTPSVSSDGTIPGAELIAGGRGRTWWPGSPPGRTRPPCAELVTLAVVGRPGVAPVAPPPGWRAVDVPVAPFDVSSTELRRRLEAGRAGGGPGARGGDPLHPAARSVRYGQMTRAADADQVRVPQTVQAAVPVRTTPPSDRGRSDRRPRAGPGRIGGPARTAPARLRPTAGRPVAEVDDRGPSGRPGGTAARISHGLRRWWSRSAWSSLS